MSRLPVEKYRKIPMEDLKTPKDGSVVYLDRYWMVHNGSVLFFNTSPQCHSNRSICERLSPDGCEIEFLPIAYLRISDLGWEIS